MKDRDMTKSAQPQLSVTTAPRPTDFGLFIELGGQEREEITRLKRGTGALTRQIQAAIDRWREELGIDTGTEVVPVVLLYRHGERDLIA
jgi:hypothetical protein